MLDGLRRHSPTEKFFAEATFVNTGVSFLFVEDDTEFKRKKGQNQKENETMVHGVLVHTVQPP